MPVRFAEDTLKVSMTMDDFGDIPSIPLIEVLERIMKTLPLTLTDRVVKPARLVVITRRDGTVMRIAEAQSAITVDGNVYAPLAGCEISAVKHTLGGETPSMEITGAHNNTGTAAFDTSDIDIGLYDAAEVQLYIVNRANPTTLGLLFTGTIQPVSYDITGRVSFDVRGPSIGAAAGYIQTLRPDVPHRSVLDAVRRQPG